jgi:hypothetical protein
MDKGARMDYVLTEYEVRLAAVTKELMMMSAYAKQLEEQIAELKKPVENKEETV